MAAAELVALLRADLLHLPADAREQAAVFIDGAEAFATTLLAGARHLRVGVAPIGAAALRRLYGEQDGTEPPSLTATLRALALGTPLRAGALRRAYGSAEIGALAAGVYLLCRCKGIGDSNAP